MANQSLKEQLQLLKQLQESQRDLNRLRELSKTMKPEDIDTDNLNQLINTIADTSDALEDLSEKIEKNKKKVDLWNSGIDELGGNLNQIAPGIQKITEAFKRNEEGVISLEAAWGSLSSTFLSGMASFAATLEQTNVELAKQSGYATALQKDVQNLASSHEGLYLAMSDSLGVVGALTTGFKMYAAQSDTMRGKINTLAGRFKVLGADAGATAEVLDKMTYIFGGSVEAATAATAELENLAIRTGQPLQAVLDGFNAVSPEMARFGSDGVRVFTRLTEKARTLGLTVQDAFKFSDMFDTFESSADVAGKLNAQLGLQLNSVEMMAASSEDRLSILRAEFDMRGVHMQDMGRRQKQMIADILQTDVLTAERLLGDPMEMRKFQREQENNAERIEKFTSSMDKFKAVAEELFINLSPLLTGILSVFNKIASVVNAIVSGPFGELISKAALFGALLYKVGNYVKPLGFAFRQVAKVLGFIITPLLLAKDILQATGFMADDKERAQAAARLQAGLASAAVGAGAGAAGLGFGAGIGAIVGYGIGREVPGIAEGFAGDINAQPGKVKSVIMRDNKKINLSALDGVKASPRVGGLEDKANEKQLKETKTTNEMLKHLIAAVEKGKVVEIDGQKAGELIMRHGNAAGMMA